jgi:hypothetical protein
VGQRADQKEEAAEPRRPLSELGRHRLYAHGSPECFGLLSGRWYKYKVSSPADDAGGGLFPNTEYSGNIQYRCRLRAHYGVGGANS